MSIRYRLRHYRYKNLELEQLQNKVLTLRNMAYSIKSASDMTGIGLVGERRNKILEVMCELEELEDEYIEKMNFIINEQKEIEELIKALDPVERLVIRGKYIEGNSFEVICNIIGYSYRQARRIHNIALDKLKDVPQCPIES